MNRDHIISAYWARYVGLHVRAASANFQSKYQKAGNPICIVLRLQKKTMRTTIITLCQWGRKSNRHVSNGEAKKIGLGHPASER
ncbi:hypothetical protein CY34DRAFT_396072 [Suillus luteus UH-Slu-Lm8-n1]|uniref:Uncharacterized protein n=1 Tax=Suillus luteus UH-Slu-Lm8-n1 TaxID=930992 RepID=A0A0D0A9E7_9AGAM|nr:hypothetical protein CY34DRAFT_396072 [Suillus luteus UH-Slu-Lm8-n1]